MRRRGFSLIEIIIVVTIIIVIAGAAIVGTRSISRDLQFTNAMNKLIFMVQQVRTRAITATDDAIAAYAVTFFVNDNPPNTAILFGDAIPGNNRFDAQTEARIEEFQVNAQQFRLVGFNADNRPCGNYATILFESRSAETHLYCNSAEEDSTMLKIGLEKLGEEQGVTTFSIHRAAGIPQM